MRIQQHRIQQQTLQIKYNVQNRQRFEQFFYTKMFGLIGFTF